METRPHLALPPGPRLSPPETRALIARAREGDREARERLIEANLRLVMSVARRFLGRGRELEDLFQAGCVGLMRAVDRFDLGYDVAFSTYAVPLIAGEIQRFLREDRPFRVSRALQALASRVEEARNALSHELGRSPTPAEVAERLGVPKEDVVAALEAAAPVASLDQTLEDDEGQGTPLIDRVRVEEEAPLPIEHLALRQVLQALKEKERELVIARFVRRMSQAEVAAAMGCSQPHVSRMERRILDRLRRLWNG